MSSSILSETTTVPAVPVVEASSRSNDEMMSNLFREVINARVLPQAALPLCNNLLKASSSDKAGCSDAASVIGAWSDFLTPKRRTRSTYDDYSGYCENDYEYECEDDCEDAYGSFAYGSFMAKKFHPAPQADSTWIPVLKRDAEWLKSKCGMESTFPNSTITPSDAQLLLDYLSEAKSVIGATGIKGYILTSDKDEEKRVADRKAHADKKKGNRHWRICAPVVKGRKTCRAQFTLISHSELVGSGSALSYHPDYVRALKFVSTLQGRVHTWFEPWITACALRMAKTGLITFHAEEVAIELAGSVNEFQTKYPITTVTLAMMVSEWGARKSFTLESQKQGALNEYLSSLLELAKASEPGALKMLGLIYPLPEVYGSLAKETKDEIKSIWYTWAKHFGLFLNDQWNLGVWKSARRQMRVLPRGSPVNSSGYNAVADAWNNMCRFMHTIDQDSTGPVFLKTLQLIANDQWRWGQIEGKGVHSDVEAFDTLTRTGHHSDGSVATGILPWEILTEPAKFERSVIEALKVPASWLGVSKSRTEETRIHGDMICGVAVPEISVETANLAKSLGVFGAGEWNGK